ncbi:MAG: hypothetical protein ACO23H_03135 [Alphaproteobacteria bacterium]
MPDTATSAGFVEVVTCEKTVIFVTGNRNNRQPVGADQKSGEP